MSNRHNFFNFDQSFKLTLMFIKAVFVFIIAVKLLMLTAIVYVVYWVAKSGVRIIVLNWCLKLFVAWLMYLLAVWLQAPEWATIALVAIGVCETRIPYSRY